VREAGFGAAEAEREPETPANHRGSTVSGNKPVRILWKPVPQYSDEAIRRRIEGDVVLLVRFPARGSVETLRIVSGLGYGLDEYALAAAESIRFEPATESGRSVDSTAQVRIRFELAY
jgi:TonB family protein